MYTESFMVSDLDNSVESLISNNDNIILNGNTINNNQIVTELYEHRAVLKKEFSKIQSEYNSLEKVFNSNVLHDRATIDDARELYNVAQSGIELQDRIDHCTYLINRIKRHDINVIKNMRDDIIANNTVEFKGFNTSIPIKSVGYAHAGSKEWLELRQNGIGGSDFGKIISRKKNDKIKLFESKVDPISQDQIVLQSSVCNGSDDAPLAITYGTNMEEFIAVEGFKQLQSLYPELDMSLTHTKETYASTINGNHIQINFDFLIVDNNSNDVIMTLEIKTAGSMYNWDLEEDTLDGCPDNYRVQALVQAIMAGAKYAALTVMIDTDNGPIIKTFISEINKIVRSEVIAYMKLANDFYNACLKYKEFPLQENKDNALELIGYKESTFPLYPKRLKNSLKDPNVADALAEAGIITGNSFDSMKSLYYLENDQVDPYDHYDYYSHKYKNKTSQVIFTDVMRGILYNYDEDIRPVDDIIGIDIETTSISPLSGSIIEIGMRPGNKDNDVYYNGLFAPNNINKPWADTGMVDVHHISLDMVKNKKPLKYCSYDILGFIQSARPSKNYPVILMAHNANFEKGWLRAHVKGFAELEAQGFIQWIDSMRVAQLLKASRTGNYTLKSVCEYVGIPYEEAHRAINDVDMMLEAYYRLYLQKTGYYYN